MVMLSIANDPVPLYQLADVHGVICYYLHHREEVDAYCAEIDRIEAELREASRERDDPFWRKIGARRAGLLDSAGG